MILFEVLDNSQVVPVMHKLASDGIRKPDGRRFLTLEDASTLTGVAVQRLWTQWFLAFGEAFPSEEIDGKPVADPGVRATAERLDRPPVPLPSLSPDEKLALLHDLHCPHLDATEFAFYVQSCEARGFSPWCRHLWPVINYDDRGNRQLQLYTTIEAVRLLAHRTGLYEGVTDPMWAGADGEMKKLWLSDQPPSYCEVRIRVKGFTEPVLGAARWKDYAPLRPDARGTTVLDPFWQKYPLPLLSKCAEMNGHRRAFGGLLGDIKIREEMATSPAATRPRRPAVPEGSQVQPEQSAPASYDEFSQADDVDLDDAPRTQTEFESRLTELVPDGVQRAAITQAYRRRYASIYSANKHVFWANVLLGVSRGIAQGTPLDGRKPKPSADDAE